MATLDSTVRSLYGNPLPAPAGIMNDRGEDVAACMKVEARPETPPNVRKWRRSGRCGAGQPPSESTDLSITFGGGITKDSDHVADVWCQPGADTDMSRLKLGMAEIIYRSSKREPLGRSYVRGHQLPKKVLDEGFRFGVGSNKSEAAKNLLYPHPTEAELQGLDLYRRSHNSYPPGEQRRRDYCWGGVDVRSHKFGRPPGSLAGNGASPNIADALRSDGGNAPARRLACKKTEDFKGSHDLLGRAKNLGSDSREALGKHVYGHEATKRGPDEWDAKACMEGEYSWMEQQPDEDLGKSIMPGFRNTVTEGRSFGVPSIRSDIPPYAKRSVADTQNYGDEANARVLVNPSQFSSVGIEDSEFFCPRGRDEVRSLFEAIGYTFPDEIFTGLWDDAVKGRCSPEGHGEGEGEGEGVGKGGGGLASIIDLQRAVNDMGHAEDVGEMERWRKEHGCCP